MPLGSLFSLRARSRPHAVLCFAVEQQVVGTLEQAFNLYWQCATASRELYRRGEPACACDVGAAQGS